ncbi:MAG TPA: PQQ-binding-like beta-propeller repeat protein [Mucilaginibacter sp.]|jgi:polyvinyl alcohol dehydrogenase (cytochrome)
MHYKINRLSLLSVFIVVLLYAFNRSGKKEMVASTQALANTQDTAAIHALGRSVFSKNCSACHGNPAFPKAPSLNALSALDPYVVLDALNGGKMRQQAKALTEQQREAVAQFVTNKPLKKAVMPAQAYTDFSFHGNGDDLHDYSGWGGNLEGTGFRTAGQSGITKANVSTLRLKWAFAFPDASEIRSKPAIVGDWLIVGSQSGEVYALNRLTGKIGWHVKASGAIRSGIVIEKKAGAVTAYFADAGTHIYAVDVKSGKVLWRVLAGKDLYPMNTGTLAVHNGKLLVPISSFEVVVAADSGYNCCKTSGALAALDSKTGEKLWYHRVIPDAATAQGKKKNGKPFYGPSGAPVWCSPTVDQKRGLVYIGTGENYTLPTTNTSDAIQAIDIKTGKLVWNFQATSSDAWNGACPVIINCPSDTGKDFDFGMAPILVTGKDGTERLLAGEKSGVVYALAPETGKLLWKTRIGKGGMLGGIHWGMASDGKYVYAANADNTVGLNTDDSHIPPKPGIYKIDVISGKVSWYTPAPAVPGVDSKLAVNSAAPVLVPGLVFAGSLDGHIRAYETANGHIIWDYNTAQKYKTVNGLKGEGGSIDSAAPVISNGMLFVNSGYGQFGEKPGNVLLAFEIAKKKTK